MNIPKYLCHFTRKWLSHEKNTNLCT